MKRLTDYTNKELSMLTEEEIAKLIDIECMSEGVPLSITPKPILKEIPEIQKPTTEVFSVDNYYFTNKDEADRLADILTSAKSRVTAEYNYNIGNAEYKYCKKYETNTYVKKLYCYSIEEYKNLSDTLKIKTEIENSNKDSMDDYNEIMSERNNIINNVWSAINNANCEMRKINNALDVYKKYIELSDGNEEIAQNFFKQNSNISKYFEIVMEEYNKD